MVYDLLSDHVQGFLVLNVVLDLLNDGQTTRTRLAPSSNVLRENLNVLRVF